MWHQQHSQKGTTRVVFVQLNSSHCDAWMKSVSSHDVRVYIASAYLPWDQMPWLLSLKIEITEMPSMKKERRPNDVWGRKRTKRQPNMPEHPFCLACIIHSKRTTYAHNIVSLAWFMMILWARLDYTSIHVSVPVWFEAYNLYLEILPMFSSFVPEPVKVLEVSKEQSPAADLTIYLWYLIWLP